MDGDFTGAPACYCIPNRVGSKFVYLDSATNSKVTLSVSQAEGFTENVVLGGIIPPHLNVAFELHPTLPADALNQFLITLMKIDPGIGVRFTFGPQGLALPMNLMTGTNITGKTIEGNPATGGLITVTFRVANFEKIKVRPELQLDQENGILATPCLKTSLFATDDKMGQKVIIFDVWLLPGFGVIKAYGQHFGVPLTLDLLEFYIPV